MIGLGGIYIDSDHFFNLCVPSTILGANFKIKSLSIFFSSLVLFINSWPLKSVKLNLANILFSSKPKSKPGNNATPVSFKRLSHIFDEVEKLLQEWKPDCCVVGLPYNLDGSESELLTRAIKFANRIKGRFNINCYGMDERLSSKAAIEQVVEDESSSKKKIAIDDIAAKIILENWFNEYNSRD